MLHRDRYICRNHYKSNYPLILTEKTRGQIAEMPTVRISLLAVVILDSVQMKYGYKRDRFEYFPFWIEGKPCLSPGTAVKNKQTGVLPSVSGQSDDAEGAARECVSRPRQSGKGLRSACSHFSRVGCAYDHLSMKREASVSAGQQQPPA